MGETRRAATKLRDSWASSIVRTVREPLVVLDGELRVRWANSSFYRTFKVVPRACEGRRIYELGDRQWDIPRLRNLLVRIVSQRGDLVDYEVDDHFPAIGRRAMLLNARRLRQHGDRAPLILLAIEDITERKRAEETRQLFLAATSQFVLDALHNIADYVRLLENGELAGRLVPAIESLAEMPGEHPWAAQLWPMARRNVGRALGEGAQVEATRRAASARKVVLLRRPTSR